jgi:hypothetical protein
MNKINITPELVQAILELNPDTLISYLDVDNNEDGSTLAYVALTGAEAGDSKIYKVTQDDQYNLVLEESEDGSPADLKNLEDEAEENGGNLVTEAKLPEEKPEAKSDDEGMDTDYTMSMCKDEMKSLSDRLAQLEGAKEVSEKSSEAVAKADKAPETEEKPKEDKPKAKSFFGVPKNLLVK